MFKTASTFAVLVLHLFTINVDAAVDVGASITTSSAYSTSLDVCHGPGTGTSLALSELGNAGKVLVISTYYTGCSPGRADAPEYTEIATTLTAEFPGQVKFLDDIGVI